MVQSIRMLATVCAALLFGAGAQASAQRITNSAHAHRNDTGGQLSSARMAAIPAGRYLPLYATGKSGTQVAAFRIDAMPVTRAEFLAFVSEHAQWRRSGVDTARAQRGSYLRSWVGDLDAGNSNDMLRPVTDVSWYAANAYCRAVGKRLPSLAEWEYVAAASATQRDASADPRQVQQQLAMYTTRPAIPLPLTGAARNVYGVSGLHDRVWEWVSDANSAIASANHAEHLKQGAHATGTASEHDMSCAGSALGAADPRNYPAFLRYALRSTLTPTSAMQSLGFRCAM